MNIPNIQNRGARALKFAAWAAFGLITLWLMAYVGVPPLVKWQLEKHGSDLLGRPLNVGSVQFQPWSLELTLHDIAVGPGFAPVGDTADTIQPPAPLSIKRIYLNAEIESLLRLAPVVQEITVEQPVLSVTHFGQGRYDIDDILARLKPAPDAPARPPGDLPRFALYNLVLIGGQVFFDDRPVGKKHALSDLQLSVPFLSNLKSKIEIKTSPYLAFKLNGSSFDTAVEATPFAVTRKTDAVIKLQDFDVAAYLPYLPASLPVRLKSALINVDAKLAFEQTPDTMLRLSGTVRAGNVVLADAAKNGELLGFDQLRIEMADVRPFDRVAKLSALELTAPSLRIVRDRVGHINLLPSPVVTSATKSIAARAGITAAGGLNNAEPPIKPVVIAVAQPSPWKIDLASLAVRSGRVTWLDETLPSAASIGFAGLTLDASAIALPFVESAPLQFKGFVSPDDSAYLLADKASLAFSGTATDRSARVSATVAAWPLQMAAKYVGQFLLPTLGGRIDAQLGVDWQAAAPERPQALRLSAPAISLKNVELAQGKVSLVAARQVDLTGVDIDLPGQRLQAAKLLLMQPTAKVERGTDSRWMYESWLAGGTSAGATQPAATATAGVSAGKTATPAWAVAIGEVALDGGAISFVDRSTPKPVAFDISNAKASLGGLTLGAPAAASPSPKAVEAKPMPLSASLRLAAGRFEAGKVDFKGGLNLAPLQLQGQLLAERLPVQAFEPYFANAVNIELLRADASFKGRMAYRQTPAGPAAQLAGDVTLADFRANTLTPSEDLLAWKALDLRGLAIAIEPAKALQVDVKETVLSDFFARVIVTPEGRINLQDLLKGPGTPTAVLSASPTTINSATETIAARAGITRATGLKDLKNTTPTAALAPVINFGPIGLVNGRVAFSDRFVKPNYSADLTGLNGKLSAFSSVGSGGTPSMADLELRGRAEGTASLEIVGKLNPLAKPLALDISGKVRDLELPPLSPYSVKYSGYGINRGKLSVDVNYLVLPNGQLTAKNKMVLNQLSFGDKVAGSTASLPVKLAVALLADRNGVIDIDLPISGSLNDPQFSLGPVIVKVILNVIVKAITAPFSLLASGLKGSDELATIGFAPGSSRLGPDAMANLDKVAKALLDRPSLRLTVVGTSSLQAERDAWARERLDDLVRAEKRRSSAASGATASAVVSVSPAEYAGLLKEVYRRADITKPRNAIGLVKDIPQAEMEQLLLASIKVTDDSMRELAVQRGVAVRDYLATRQLPLDRLFLGANKTVLPDASYSPRAELNLALP